MGLTTEQAVGMEFKVQATIRDRLEKASFKADLALLKNIFSRGINVEERVEETFRNDAMDVENNHGGNCPSDQFFLAVASINTLVQRCCSNVDDNAENDPRYEEHLDKVLKELMQFGGDDFSVLLGTYRNQEDRKSVV